MSVSENKQEEKGEKEEKTGETEEEESGERRGVKRKISLTRCDVCETEDAKYRCPNCLKFSCSLSCVKQHKQESGCSGVRDQTAFVRLSQFSELNLLNDYRFLEETARVADKPNRDTLLHTHPHHSVTVKLVRKNAAAAKVNLKILPKSFSRRRENNSIYIKAEQKLYWHLKLHFPQSDAQYTDRVPEDRLLEQILSDYVHPTESDPVKRQRLKLYVLAAPDRLSVFMMSEQRQPGSLRYHELDLKKSLRENLMFKTVVEYPELYVVLKEHRQEYLTRFPERKSVSSEPKESSTPWEPPRLAVSSRDDPEPSEDLKHREKKRKCVADCSELEEGEIRSEEEEEEDEVEEHVGKVGHAKEPKGLDADHLPHKDDSSSDEDDNDDGDEKSGTSSRQNETMDTNAPPSQNPGEDGDGKVQVDAAAVNNQNPAMKTDLGLPHEGEEEKMEEEDGQDSTANDLNGTMKTNDPPAAHDRCEKNEEGHPPPLGHGWQVGDEGQVCGVIDKKVTMNVEFTLPPPSHDQAMAEDDDDDVLDAPLDQKVTMQTTTSSLPGLREDGADGGAGRAKVHANVTTDQVDGGGSNADVADDQKMIMETDAHLPPGHGELVSDEGQVHGGGDSASAVNDQKVTMDVDCLPSSAHEQSTTRDCGEDGGEVLVHSDGDRAPDVNDQKMSKETDGLPPASLDENVEDQDGDQDGADGHVIGPVQAERVDTMERPPTDGLV